MNNKEFYITDNKYLAGGLSFLGFRYYKFTNYEGKIVYSFKITDKLIEQIELLFKLKQENYNE